MPHEVSGWAHRQLGVDPTCTMTTGLLPTRFFWPAPASVPPGGGPRLHGIRSQSHSLPSAQVQSASSGSRAAGRSVDGRHRTHRQTSKACDVGAQAPLVLHGLAGPRCAAHAVLPWTSWNPDGGQATRFLTLPGTQVACCRIVNANPLTTATSRSYPEHELVMGDDASAEASRG